MDAFLELRDKVIGRASTFLIVRLGIRRGATQGRAGSPRGDG
jgi:hypothetical protein